MPVDLNLPRKAQRIILMIMRYQFAQRCFCEKVLGLDYYSARNFLPAQRRFHRTRLRDSNVLNPKDYRAAIRQRPQMVSSFGESAEFVQEAETEAGKGDACLSREEQIPQIVGKTQKTGSGMDGMEGSFTPPKAGAFRVTPDGPMAI